MARPRTGFVYAAGDGHPLKGAIAGAHVALRSPEPPWIVVDHDLGKILVARWPGRLFAVEIIEADPEAQRGLVRDVWYTRATAVKVLEELPLARLFGANGSAVCRIIETARQLDVDQVRRLAAARSKDAATAYSAAWNRWLAQRGVASSPINSGFSVIGREVRIRARTLIGDSAFVIDREGEAHLDPVWSDAGVALLEAAMAAGRPDLVTEQDRRTLTRAWTNVFGPI